MEAGAMAEAVRKGVRAGVWQEKRRQVCKGAKRKGVA